MIRVAVSGATGQMGTAACEALSAADGIQLTGRAAPSIDVSVTDVLHEADVLVDLSTPAAAPENAREAVRAGVHAVVGTTGFDVEALRETVSTDRAGGANCFVVPNFAIGAVLMMQLAARVARHLPSCAIVELHHDGKRDAPSGTARRTAELVAAASGAADPTIHSVRLPGLVAHQEIIFGGEGETLAVRHDSTDRRSFMPGMLLAVRRIGQLSDPFTMGLENVV